MKRESESTDLLRYRRKELIKHRQFDNEREIIAETIRTTHGTSNKVVNDNNILKRNRIKSGGVTSPTYLGIVTSVMLWVAVFVAYYDVSFQAHLPWVYILFLFEAIYSGNIFYYHNLLNESEFKQYVQKVRLTAPILELNVRNMKNTSILCKFSRWYDHTNVPMYKLDDANIEIIQVTLQESWHSLNTQTKNKIELQKMKYMNKYNKTNMKTITIDDVHVTCRVDKLAHVYVSTNALVGDHQGQHTFLIQYKALLYTLLTLLGLSILCRLWYSLTHSHTHLLTHSLTHTLSHYLTYSLTQDG